MGPCVVEACAWEHGRLGNDDRQVLVRTQLNKRTGDWCLRGIREVRMQAYAAANACQELGARHGAAWRNVQALACVPTSVRTDEKPVVRAASGVPLCRRMRPGRQLSARAAERSNLDGTACIYAVYAYHVGVVSLTSKILGTQGQDRDHGGHVRKGPVRVVGA
jgi:hypothetical protein